MDIENYGYLNKSQFFDLVDLIKSDGDFDKEELYKKVNPNDVEHVTFSEVVEGFAKEYVNKNGQLINVLEFIYLI